MEFSFPCGYKMAARVPGVTTVSYRRRERLPLPEVSSERNSLLVISQLMSPQVSLAGLCPKSLVKPSLARDSG